MKKKFKQKQNLTVQATKGLQTKNKIPQSPETAGSEIFIENIDKDEMRDGFLVTSHRKKLWNVQIGLIKEVERICKKHNIRWTVAFGTLLGAIRHKGFIPWDDDADIEMLRPDYEKFTQVAPYEIKYPYFYDHWGNYRMGDCDFSAPDEQQYPLIPLEQCQGGVLPRFPIIKIRDSRTTMIELPRTNVNQGIWLDIFPVDSIPPPPDTIEQDTAEIEELRIKHAIGQALLAAIQFPEVVKKRIADGEDVTIPPEQMEQFLNFTYRQKVTNFEYYLAQNFSPTAEYVTWMAEMTHFYNNSRPVKREVYDDIIYVPFEKTEMPVLKDYDAYLTAKYGDWREPVFSPGHIQDFCYSADIPYTEFFSKSIFLN